MTTNPTVLVFGDSMSAVGNELAAWRPCVKVDTVNGAESDERLTDLSNIPWERYETVIICLGTNDCKNNAAMSSTDISDRIQAVLDEIESPTNIIWYNVTESSFHGTLDANAPNWNAELDTRQTAGELTVLDFAQVLKDEKPPGFPSEKWTTDTIHLATGWPYERWTTEAQTLL